MLPIRRPPRMLNGVAPRPTPHAPRPTIRRIVQSYSYSGFPAATLPAYDSSKAHSWSSPQIRGAGLMERGELPFRSGGPVAGQPEA